MITKEINLGKVAPVGKREYSTETSYDVLDIVSYHGQSYMSLHADNVGNDPSADSDETHWMLLAERGESWYQMCVRTGRFTGTEEEFLNEKQKQIDDATAAAKRANESSEEALRQASNAKVQADRARDIAIITEELYALVERENSSWMAKEQARENAELARANAEKLRAQAETTRVSNENTRVSQEETRQTNESTRNLSEEARVKREALRVEIENIRIDNENARKEAERLRIVNENERASEETKRVNAENVRAESETERNLSEEAREESEKGRVEAEQARVAAEKLREQKRIECEQATKNANDASDSANSAASYAKEVGDHQPIIGEDGYWYRWNADNDAYDKTDQYAHGSPLYPTPSIKNNKLIMTDNGSNLSQRISLVSNKLIFKF